MYTDGKIYMGLANNQRVNMDLGMSNRHGLIAGASGTGKTITMKAMAESFSDAGVPVFLCDVKGDVSGLASPVYPAREWRSVLISLVYGTASAISPTPCVSGISTERVGILFVQPFPIWGRSCCPVF